MRGSPESLFVVPESMGRSRRGGHSPPRWSAAATQPRHPQTTLGRLPPPPTPRPQTVVALALVEAGVAATHNALDAASAAAQRLGRSRRGPAFCALHAHTTHTTHTHVHPCALPRPASGGLATRTHMRIRTYAQTHTLARRAPLHVYMPHRRTPRNRHAQAHRYTGAHTHARAQRRSALPGAAKEKYADRFVRRTSHTHTHTHTHTRAPHACKPAGPRPQRGPTN